MRLDFWRALLTETIVEPFETCTIATGASPMVSSQSVSSVRYTRTTKLAAPTPAKR
jgi:hypothetical protein